MFFFLPVGVDYRTDRFPVVTFSLIGINTAVFLISVIALLTGGRESALWIMENFWLIPSQSGWPAYFTTLFVHAGLFHLLGNMIYLFLFGAAVEDKIGRGQFVIFYLLSGLAADLAHIIATPGHFASVLPLGGASGAISGCIGGFVLLFRDSKINFRYFIWFLRLWSGDFWLPAWLVISFWFASDFLSAALSYLNEDAAGVAFAAHVGGFLCGFTTIAGYKLWRRWNEAEEKKAQVIGSSRLQTQRLEPTPMYLFDSGAQIGPVTRAQISEMLAISSITADALYWHEAKQEWRSVAEL